jgi:DNA repair protein RecO (recombination protein O)
MPPILSDALVLRTYDFGETSRVVVLLTRDRGKMRAVAKGARVARSRYQSALEPLSEVRVGLHGRQGAELFRLGQCELIHSAFRASEQGLETAMSLSYFAELLDAFAQEGQAEDAVYRLALAVIREAEGGSEVAVLTRYLEAWMLRLQGLYPSLDHCAGCHEALPPGALAYHGARHGFVCAGCGPAHGPILPASTREFLRDAFRRSPSEIAREKAPASAPLESFHRELITRHLERELRSHRVLREVARETYR